MVFSLVLLPERGRPYSCAANRDAYIADGHSHRCAMLRIGEDLAGLNALAEMHF
jgi:hypothetical protein